MPLLEIGLNNFEHVIETHPIVFIDFWAKWCVPCETFAQVYDTIAKQNPSILFAKVNIEQESELSGILQLRSIPHLMIFKEGIAIYSEAGQLPKPVLEELVEQALLTDINPIRSKIARGE